MKTPIFVYEPDTLYVFSTKEKAEACMEAVDVRNHVYTAVYDAEGNLLNLSVKSDDEIIIEPMNSSLNKSDDLRTLLYDFFKFGRPVVTDSWLTSASLDELVTKALEFKTR